MHRDYAARSAFALPASYLLFGVASGRANMQSKDD
jgi:hypothetical protein